MANIIKISNVVRRTLTSNGETRQYFVGTLRSDLAKQLSFVPVIENSKKTYLNEEIEDGYQRPGSATRMGQFAKYLHENPLSVVPPVVLSGRSNWKFKGNSEVGELEISGAAAVIDGQHRLGGYIALYEKEGLTRDIDFVLISGLSLEDEKEEFLTINTNAKGVSKSIQEYIKGQDEMLVATELNNNPNSVLQGTIQIASRKPGNIFTLATVVKCITDIFEYGSFKEHATLDEKVEIMMQYWQIIADTFPEEFSDISSEKKMYKLLETTGLLAMSKVGYEILGSSYDSHTHTMNWPAVETKLNVIANSGELDWTKDGEFKNATGNVGAQLIHRRIQEILASWSAANHD